MEVVEYGYRDKTRDSRSIYEAQSADSRLREAIHENHNEEDAFAYHNVSMDKVADSLDQSLSNYEMSATTRSDCNRSSTCGQKPQTKPPRSASLSSQKDTDFDRDHSSRSSSQSLKEGIPNSDTANIFPDTSLKTGKHNNKKSKKHIKCPTRANLPPKSASHKLASVISGDCQLGIDPHVGGEGQNQQNGFKRGHDAFKRTDLTELQPSSTAQNQAIMGTYIQRPEEDVTHKSVQKTKESSKDTSINKKVHDTSEYMLLGKDQYGQANITHATIDTQAHDLIATERGINMMGRSNEQESYETTNHDVPAMYRGEGTESTSEEDSQQGHVSQPVQTTSRDWESPVIVHSGLVHPLNMIIEQPPEESSDHVSPSFSHPTEEQEVDHLTSEITFPRSSFGRNLLSGMTWPSLVVNTSIFSHEPLVLPCHIPLASQGIHLVGVLIENAVTYCSVSRPINCDITCRLRTMLHQAQVRLLLVEIRFDRVRRRLLVSPGRIDCVLLRQVHCHVRQIVNEVKVMHDQYHQAQLQFQCIQALSLHSNCRPQHAECLRQLQRSCYVRTCQGLRSTSLLLDRVSCLLSTIFHQLQRPNNVMAAVHVPPSAPIVHIPRQPTTQLASLTGPGNIQPLIFQVQVEEETKDLVSKTN